MTLNLRSLSNNYMFSLTLIIFSLLATINIARAAENVTAILDVPGMTCKLCPITIRKALEKVPGVVEAKSELKTKTATVTFDPGKTNIEALMKATANAGYPSSQSKK